MKSTRRTSTDSLIDRRYTDRFAALRRKTLVILALALVSLLSIIYFTASTLLFASLRLAEEQTIQQSVTGARQIIDLTLKDFNDRFLDWSAWDDTYQFIADATTGQLSDYRQSNLTAEALSNMNVNFVLYQDTAGRSIYQTGVDINQRQKIPLASEIRSRLNSSLLRTSDQPKILTGLLAIAHRPVIVTAQPILTSLGQGPIRGTLIFGRNLDLTKIQSLANCQCITLQAIDDPNLPADFQTARRQLQQRQIVSQQINETTIAGYTILLDIYQQPSFLLRVEQPRTIYQQGQKNARYLLHGLLVAGAVFGLIAYILLERLLLLRRKRQESEARYRLVVSQASEGISLIDAYSKRFLETNAALQNLLGYSARELQNLTLYDIVNDSPEAIEASIQPLFDRQLLNEPLDEQSNNQLNVQLNDRYNGRLDEQVNEQLNEQLNRRLNEQRNEHFNEQYFTGEQKYYHQQGHLIDVEVTANHIPDFDRRILCIIVRDITDRKRIEAEKASLYQQTQQFNTELEAQVRERTLQLQKAYDLEATLKRITDKVRDSLDESQILQTAVQELAKGLQVECCDAGVYDLKHQISTIQYECTLSIPSALGLRISMSSESAVYSTLLQGYCTQFCWITLPPRTMAENLAILACPIVDDQGVIGDVWLFKQRHEIFSELEVRLVQQVVNQGAIAIRQARLYQETQSQVLELEKLNRLKDDFLSTVSHELRTPMSNIKMALQMLEIALSQIGLLQEKTEKTTRYFQILNDECQREIGLINDLLDLSRLDAGAEVFIASTIEPSSWLAHVVEPFLERTHNHNQQFEFDVPDQLPFIQTDLSKLERIVTELLNNACKYTPAGKTITLAARALDAPIASSNRDSVLDPYGVTTSTAVDAATIAQTTSPAAHPSATTTLQIMVKNSGVTIAANELSRIFDKFYRVPNNDPWQHGGTGLGLALVQKLVSYLGGMIQVESVAQELCFTIELPSQRQADPPTILDGA